MTRCDACPLAEGEACPSATHPRYCTLAREQPGLWGPMIVGMARGTPQGPPPAGREGTRPNVPESRGAPFTAILEAVRACDYLGPLAERPTEAGGGPMYACECATKYYVCGLGKGSPLPGVGPPVVHFGDCYRCLASSRVRG